MSSMFSGCKSITSLNLSNFNTSKVTNMSSMFSSTTSLTSLNLSSFNTEKVTNMSSMFFGKIGLSTIDVSSFNTRNVTNMYRMFGYDSNVGDLVLKTIKVGPNFTTNSVTNSSDMFYYRSKLVGGAGTTWSLSNPTDKTYAHIDGGTANPGYFTSI